MVIYVDLLISLNFIIDFMLLSLTALIIRTDIKTLRQLTAAAVGGTSSLYIFFESKYILLDVLYKVVVAAVMVLICLGFKSGIRYLKCLLTYISSSLFLSGLLSFICQITKTDGIATNNTYVYFEISPLTLIAVTLVLYICAKLYFRFRKNKNLATDCFVKLFLDDLSFEGKGFIDSGNSVKDILSDSEVLFIGSEAFNKFAGYKTPELMSDNEVMKNRFRLIPIRTVKENSMISGIRCDKAEIKFNENTVEFKNPILAVSDKKLSDDFDILVPASALDKEPVILSHKKGKA